jgi:hypothetical protein
MKLLIAQFGATLFYFTKNALHLKKSTMLRPKSRLKGGFFSEKATKKQTKFGQNIQLFLKKRVIFTIPSNDVNLLFHSHNSICLK